MEQKKNYKKPESKEIQMKHEASLLSSSGAVINP